MSADRSTPAGSWLARPVAGVAATIVLLAFAAHVVQALGGAYLSYVSGIWLALGRDLSAGTFYRNLLGPLGYGGTRYFPLFFVLVAAGLRADVSPLAAGWLASGASAVVLVTGVWRSVRALGVPPRAAVVWAAASLGPYFVHQTLFEIRADVLAAGLNLWGLALVIDRAQPRGEGRGLAAPVVMFTLALAAKVTSLAIPIAAAAGLLVGRRRRTGWRLAAATAVGAAVFFAVTALASGGRAIASWRACMFAGESQGQTILALVTGQFVQLARYSHLLTVLFVLDAAAVVALLWPRASDRASSLNPWLPVTVLAGATASAAFALSSPGTVPSNQVVEWIAISLVALAAVAVNRPRLAKPAAWVVVGLAVWTSAQDVVRVRDLRATESRRMTAAARAELVDLVAHSPRPVLSENPLWPVLAGRQPYMLDPFALRVVMLSRPDVFADIRARLDAHFFSLVILQVDPTTVRGRGYYEHVNFGWPVTERILADYQFDRQMAPDVFVYRPRSAPQTEAAAPGAETGAGGPTLAARPGAQSSR
jgi:hypothetical protein